MAKLKVTETILRDAQQVLVNSRMTTADMQPILNDLDKVGFYSCEVWGGNTYDTSIRLLEEDPWDRLRLIRQAMPNTKLQMLCRGQNMLEYKHHADDAVEYFIQRVVANGIDIIRTFDPLNDARNLETTISTAKREGAQVQGCISYTVSPMHNTDYFVGYAKRLESLGADSICLKDTTGILTPYTAYELIGTLKRTVNLPLQLHSHEHAGLAAMSFLKAAEAGVDIIDTSLTAFAMGASNPATETMITAFSGTPYATGLDIKKLESIHKYLVELRNRYLSQGLLKADRMVSNPISLQYQLPEDMFYDICSQLEELRKSDLLVSVLQEVNLVRRDVGYLPLVTPISQIVGKQAILNIINGSRYQTISEEFRSLARGEYGKIPAPLDPVLRRQILGEEQVIDCRPADLLEPELEKAKQTLPEKYNEQEEDVLTLIQFPQVAPKYFQERTYRLYGVDGKHADEENQIHPV